MWRLRLLRFFFNLRVLAAPPRGGGTGGGAMTGEGVDALRRAFTDFSVVGSSFIFGRNGALGSGLGAG